MAEFNAMDTAAFKGVWVFCEQREGEIQSISYQLLSEGRKLANDLGVELAGVVMGSGLAEADLKTLGGYGADRVYNIDSPLLKDYTTDGYAKALCDLIMDKKPEIMLIGATNLGRDLGPRCAARLHTGLTADCTHLDVDVEKYKNFLRTTSNIDVDNTKFEENTNLKMTRPAFGGHLMATIICPRFRPQKMCIRDRAYLAISSVGWRSVSSNSRVSSSNTPTLVEVEPGLMTRVLMDMINAVSYTHLGVAMGNACEEAKAAADYVTDDIMKDGLAKALEHFGLL